jgi:glycosyltransferase involved in cell wall biosynthesis
MKILKGFTLKIKRFYPKNREALHEISLTSDLIMVNQSKDLVTVPNKTVLMLHGSIQYCYPSELKSKSSLEKLKKELNSFKAVAACSNWAAQSIEKITDKKVGVIYPPVDPAFLSTHTRKRQSVVGFSGRISPYKGADIFIDIAKQPIVNHLSFEMTDFSNDSSLKSIFISACDSKVVTPIPSFTKAGDHAKYISSLSAVVVPSRVEGFGLVAAEAQIAGSFVIAPSLGGLLESVHPDSGVLTELSIDSLTQALLENIGRPVSLDTRIDLFNRFSVEKSCSAFLDLL